MMTSGDKIILCHIRNDPLAAHTQKIVDSNSARAMNVDLNSPVLCSERSRLADWWSLKGGGLQ